MLGTLSSSVRRRAAATVVAVLAAGLVPLTALPARAVVVVTNCNDDGPGSLRQAVATAVAGDTITFAVICPTITLTSGEILIDKHLTIDGPGAATLTIARDLLAASFRIFNIAAGAAVTISGVTISNGQATEGGGILNAGSLTLTNSTVANNTATCTPAPFTPVFGVRWGDQQRADRYGDGDEQHPVGQHCHLHSDRPGLVFGGRWGDQQRVDR